MDSDASQDLKVANKITGFEPTHIDSPPRFHDTEDPESDIPSTNLRDSQGKPRYVEVSDNSDPEIQLTEFTSYRDDLDDDGDILDEMMSYISPLRDPPQEVPDFIVTIPSETTTWNESRYFIVVNDIPGETDELDDILEDTLKDVLSQSSLKDEKSTKEPLVVYDTESVQAVYHTGFYIREVVCHKEPKLNTDDLDLLSYITTDYTLGEKLPLWKERTYSKYSLRKNNFIIDKLAEFGCIDILNQFYNYDKSLFSYSYLGVARASGNGHVDVLDWFEKRGYIEEDHTPLAIELSVKNGRTESLDWWWKNQTVFLLREISPLTAVMAIRSKQYAVLEWFKKHTPDVLDSTCEPLNFAIEQNDVKAVVWYLDNIQFIKYDTPALAKADPYIRFLLRGIRPTETVSLPYIKQTAGTGSDVAQASVSFTKYAIGAAVGLTTGYLVVRKLFWK